MSRPEFTGSNESPEQRQGEEGNRYFDYVNNIGGATGILNLSNGGSETIALYNVEDSADVGSDGDKNGQLRTEGTPAVVEAITGFVKYNNTSGETEYAQVWVETDLEGSSISESEFHGTIGRGSDITVPNGYIIPGDDSFTVEFQNELDEEIGFHATVVYREAR